MPSPKIQITVSHRSAPIAICASPSPPPGRQNQSTDETSSDGFWAPFGPAKYWFRDRYADNIDSEDGPDTAAVKNVRLVSVKEGSTHWEIDIEPHLCNKGKNLHGGAACTILDNLTSTALLTIAKPGFLDGGHVSRTITMSYLRPVPMYSKAEIECRVVAAGKSTANLYGEIRVDGKVCVTCIHDKAVFNQGSGRGLPPKKTSKL
jgi:acyl-coenzyme A thioesterase PaaI-like protein